MGTKFFVKTNIPKRIKKMIKDYPKVREEALTKGGLQMINWIVNGSPRESVVPPVLTGALRGSGSVFVGGKFITATPDESGEGTPLKSYSAKPNTITWIFNTAYATRLHERKWTPGEVSQQSGNVGNKFIRKHLKADKELLLEFIAKIYRSNY
jgi:hypothetical protein